MRKFGRPSRWRFSLAILLAVAARCTSADVNSDTTLFHLQDSKPATPKFITDEVDSDPETLADNNKGDLESVTSDSPRDPESTTDDVTNEAEPGTINIPNDQDSTSDTLSDPESITRSITDNSQSKITAFGKNATDAVENNSPAKLELLESKNGEVVNQGNFTKTQSADDSTQRSGKGKMESKVKNFGASEVPETVAKALPDTAGGEDEFDNKGKFFLFADSRTTTKFKLEVLRSTTPYTCLQTASTAQCQRRRRRDSASLSKLLLERRQLEPAHPEVDLQLDGTLDDPGSTPLGDVDEGRDSKGFLTVWTTRFSTKTITSYVADRGVSVSVSAVCIPTWGPRLPGCG